VIAVISHDPAGGARENLPLDQVPALLKDRITASRPLLSTRGRTRPALRTMTGHARASHIFAPSAP